MSRLVGPRGPEWAKVMVVGEAPGNDEVKAGQPFVGKAGQLLQRFLMDAGVDPDEIYYTNICQIQPPGNQIVRFFDPDTGMPGSEIMQGLAHLRDQIEIVNPNLIVALGNYPLWALTGKSKWNKKKRDETKLPYGYTGIGNWRGSIVKGSALAGGRKVLATYHPAFILREGMAEHGFFLMDLRKIAVEKNYPEVREREVEHILDPHGPERMEVLERIMDEPGKVVSADIEYVGKSLVCVGFTNDRSWSATIATRSQTDLAFVRRVLLEGGSGLCWQNAMFDASILEWHYKMPVLARTVFDTMLCAHAASPELAKSLEVLASMYTYPNQPYWKDMINWNLVKKGAQTIEDVMRYNLIDVDVTQEVMEEQIKEELTDQLTRDTFDFEMMLLNPLWIVAQRGVKIDTYQMEKLRQETTTELAERMVLLRALAGFDINVKSNKDVGIFLYIKQKLPVLKKNPTGPATDDKTLAQLEIKAATEEQRNAVRLIREIRVRRDLLSKFIEVQFDVDERARGIYNPAGTVTGRLSSKKFYPTGLGVQQQNVPRDKRVRKVYVPDRGKRFCYADLERAESLVVAHITNDPLMLAHHAPGVDAHKALASLLFDKLIDDILEDERYLGKQTRHAGNYMEGHVTFQRNVNKLASKTGVSIELGEAKRFIDRYRDLHPFLKSWWTDVKQQLWDTRTIINLVGRRRIFYGHVESSVPEAVAYNPQSTVGDVLNMAVLHLTSGDVAPYLRKLGLEDHYKTLIEELRTLGGVEMLLQVHDAIGFQYDPKHEDKILPLVSKLMSIPLTSPKTYEDFTIPVEIAIGTSWGEVKKWELGNGIQTAA
jgi:uracil-DNA glycosylase family 4